jgi:hypothetical protein
MQPPGKSVAEAKQSSSGDVIEAGARLATLASVKVGAPVCSINDKEQTFVLCSASHSAVEPESCPP